MFRCLLYLLRSINLWHVHSAIFIRERESGRVFCSRSCSKHFWSVRRCRQSFLCLFLCEDFSRPPWTPFTPQVEGCQERNKFHLKMLPHVDTSTHPPHKTKQAQREQTQFGIEIYLPCPQTAPSTHSVRVVYTRKCLMSSCKDAHYGDGHSHFFLMFSQGNVGVHEPPPMPHCGGRYVAIVDCAFADP